MAPARRSRTSPPPTPDRLWPLGNGEGHFQASVFAGPEAAQEAVSAAKELELRRFRVQVFRSNGGLRSLEAAFQEAAPVSSRLVMVETSAAQSRLGLAASRSLARNRIGIPLVRLSFAGPGKQRAGSVPRIMEACLRNLE